MIDYLYFDELTLGTKYYWQFLVQTARLDELQQPRRNLFVSFCCFDLIEEKIDLIRVDF